MKKILPADIPERNYFSLPFLPLHWEVLKTALLLNVFEHLKQPKSADETAALIEGQTGNTLVLRMCCPGRHWTPASFRSKQRC